MAITAMVHHPIVGPPGVNPTKCARWRNDKCGPVDEDVIRSATGLSLRARDIRAVVLRPVSSSWSPARSPRPQTR